MSSAPIVPFPLARRHAFVRRQALWFLAQGHEAAEHGLRQQIAIQRDNLLKKGVPTSVVSREVAKLEVAIRAHVRRLAIASERAR